MTFKVLIAFYDVPVLYLMGMQQEFILVKVQEANTKELRSNKYTGTIRYDI